LLEDAYNGKPGGNQQMKTIRISARHAAFALTALTLSPSALAAWEWQFTDSTNASCTTTGACPWTSTRSATNSLVLGQPAVSASGLSNTGGTNGTKAVPDTSATTGYLQSAYLSAWGSSGLGVINRDAYTVLNNGSATDGGSVDNTEGGPNEHAMDNNERYDAILFSFSSAVTLTGVKIGWWATDSDISVLAYTPTGSGDCTPSAISGTGTSACKWGSLTGWSSVGNYSNLATNANTPVNGGANPYSSNYWIIAAYIPAYGGGFSSGNDYLKLVSIYGDVGKPPGQVPEPSSALLVGVAALGLWGARRRQAR
jgi:hypothetical protein